MNNGSHEGLAVALARMARDLLAQNTVQSTLDRIASFAVELVDGCEHAGILLVHPGREIQTAAATSDLVRESDRLQGELGEGPCLDAARNREEVYRIADMTREEYRWTRYVPHARRMGIGSMMGFLLYTDEDELGALDLYSSRPSAFTEHSELVGWLLASHAAVAFSSARTAAQLHAAIATRQDIGEALGIIMERYKITGDEAFKVLKHSSQEHNVKLRDIARRITETGSIPGAR
ncbi:ANTAR domain-containing protein [Saccharopolyspora erythraea NRRL 2338]|uniref:Uncharacterized protein n=2 Tax=Saccharopolyspora erythraea TaxID=1836 RepID=A4FPF1_SACEN|nr:GAF and ANTAR domain-containing protein [Saccharopolyspora erythraea]EQD82304.1 transcription antitermination regulator [Saccharopolyspora erythraea D]PFG99566.1 ANTAR domain-containing protein [Saccharopolyspora erythraea NRRL 2338]QRK89464.1 GAF and ANTAR domain-containing protein [Saccharopolyspora erythraea]CAM05926.1 hypothetical protein SACE_6760 [Saccharopolyspora erythraea NRRL 2338]